MEKEVGEHLAETEAKVQEEFKRKLKVQRKKKLNKNLKLKLTKKLFNEEAKEQS